MEELEQDLTALHQLDIYLKQYGFPQTRALPQERSFEIFHNEKWISEHGGKQFLEKVRVWELLEIWPIADPVSFAVNPNSFNEEMHRLLIVENKATFYSLLPALKDANFTALLYGQGKAIHSTIQVLPEQLPLNYERVKYYYFGDLDAEGIAIWYKLQQKHPVTLALPFYRACLQKEVAKGKEYQRKNNEAIETFCYHFSSQEAKKIKETLQEGFYYPQEILNAEALCHIWRDADWT